MDKALGRPPKPKKIPSAILPGGAKPPAAPMRAEDSTMQVQRSGNVWAPLREALNTNASTFYASSSEIPLRQSAGGGTGSRRRASATAYGSALAPQGQPMLGDPRMQGQPMQVRSRVPVEGEMAGLCSELLGAGEGCHA